MTLEVYERRLLPVVYEHWLPVVGWEDSYEVSCRGRVRSLDRWRRARLGWRLIPGQLMAQEPDPDGYPTVRLRRPPDGSGKRRRVHVHVHVLVLLAFAGAPKPGEIARHGPLGPDSNRWPEDLCWGTRADNNGADRRRDGTIINGERVPNAILTEVIVLECRRRHYVGGEPIPALAAEHGVTRWTLGNAVRLNGKTWRHLPFPPSII